MRGSSPVSITQTAMIGALVALALVGASTQGQAPSLNACKLLSAAEASQLAGQPLSLKRQMGTATFATCVYQGAQSSPMDLPNHVEVSYGSWPDAATAHTRFQGRVQPGGRSSPNTTVTPVPGLGDEAAIKRTPSFGLNSIDVRKGAVVVSFGVKPIVADGALEAAAKTALSRLP